MAVIEPDPTENAPSPEALAEGSAPTTEAPEAPPARDWAAQVEEWGGESNISDAIEIANALREEDGVRALVEEGLKHLGYDPTVVFSPGEPAEPKDPDEFLTRAEVEQRLAEMQDLASNQALQVRVQAAAAAVDETRQALGVTSEDEWDMVRTFAQNHTTPDELDPSRLAEAVRKGHADYERALERAAKAYVEKKAAANSGVPQPIVGGGVAGGENAPEAPKNMDEARAAARKYLSQFQ